MNTHTSIKKREVKKTHRDGRVSMLTRYVLNYKNPATGRRSEKFFETRKAAEAFRNDLIKNADSMKRRKNAKPPTLQEAVDYWIKTKENAIQQKALHAYKQTAKDYIIGPIFKGSRDEKYRYGVTKKLPPKAKLVNMLPANIPINEIGTADIRMWQQRLLTVTSPYNTKLARKHLASIFRLIEEDYDIRLARMPSKAAATYRRKKRKLLTEDQAKMVIQEAWRDKKWGAYYAFLILTGVRPSEMLGLLWEDVNLEKRYITICRTQADDTRIKDNPKTDAGVRRIPFNDILYDFLVDWKERCPRLHGKLYRVFPAQGHEHGKGRIPRDISDRGISINNFRIRVWYPVLDRLGLPRVALYALRHMAISHLQAQGVEIGQVAKIAGHASPQITLQYYTHAVREDQDVMNKLNAAYGIKNPNTASRTEVQP